MIGIFFERAVMWCQFVSFTEFVKPQTKVTSSSGINIFLLLILEVVSFLMLTILYLLVNNKTLMLSVDRNYEFTSGMMIPYLTHLPYAKMDVCVL